MQFYNPVSKRYLSLVIATKNRGNPPDNPFKIMAQRFSQIPPTNEGDIRTSLSEKEINDLIHVLNASQFTKRATGPFGFSFGPQADPLFAGGYVMKVVLRGSNEKQIEFVMTMKRKYGQPLHKWRYEVVEHLRQLAKRKFSRMVSTTNDADF